MTDRRELLNDRNLRVLECLAEGRSTAEIAGVLGVSRNTARTRIRRVAARLEVEGRDETVRAARELRMPEPRRPPA